MFYGHYSETECMEIGVRSCANVANFCPSTTCVSNLNQIRLTRYSKRQLHIYYELLIVVLSEKNYYNELRTYPVNAFHSLLLI